MYYIGLDIHSKGTQMSVLNSKGKEVGKQAFLTSEKELRNSMERLRGKKAVVFEESTLASWANRILSPYADHVISADPRENKWIANATLKDDKVDAKKLAELLRGGFIKPVYHSPDEARQRFKELVLHYHDLTSQVIRFKNKLKAKFRYNGIFPSGDHVYNIQYRKEWTGKLANPQVVFQINNIYKIIDLLEKSKDKTHKKIATLSKKYPEISRFQDIPGVGLVVASTIFAIVDTPERFATKKKLWAYAGLGLVNRGSSETSERKRLNHKANSLLKYVLKIAAKEAVASDTKDNPFKKHYNQLLDKGSTPANASLTISRSILSVMYGIWKKGEDYKPDYRKS